MSQPVEIKFLADEALCIRERDLIHLPKKKCREYEVHHEDMGLIGKAKIYPVLVGDPDVCEPKEYLADVETGSLYDPATLRCLTGHLRLV